MLRRALLGGTASAEFANVSSADFTKSSFSFLHTPSKSPLIAATIHSMMSSMTPRSKLVAFCTSLRTSAGRLSRFVDFSLNFANRADGSPSSIVSDGDMRPESIPNALNRSLAATVPLNLSDDDIFPLKLSTSMENILAAPFISAVAVSMNVWMTC